MNRAEAYEILAGRISQTAEMVRAGGVSCPFSISDEASGRETSTRYTIEIKLMPNADGSMRLYGSIHDNNTAKFELLEETLVITNWQKS